MMAYSKILTSRDSTLSSIKTNIYVVTLSTDYNLFGTRDTINTSFYILLSSECFSNVTYTEFT